MDKQRKYWVVSPNVKNSNRTVGEWRQASVTMHAAFMGWGPNDPKHGQIGPKFAGKVAPGIEPGDVILIARRSGGEPEVVGFGVVEGEATTTLTGLHLPDHDIGSLRKLQPFVPRSAPPDRRAFRGGRKAYQGSRATAPGLQRRPSTDLRMDGATFTGRCGHINSRRGAKSSCKRRSPSSPRITRAAER